MDGKLSTDNAQAGTESLVILQTLLCMLREKNLLNRADIEELCDRVARVEAEALPCCPDARRNAANLMARIGGYIGQHYGGKHRRGAWAPTRS